MSVQEIQSGTSNITETKKILEKWDVNAALNNLLKVSEGTIENKKEELAGLFEIWVFTRNLNEENITNINDILSQFLTPQNLTA